ncbi:MAG: hypothetical protein HRT71_10240 [Flavobacteriales bacterium]|nr:hypothetical protein [Flavobacteriales bacterium]
MLAAFVPYFYISQFANPIADDFTYANRGAHNDLSFLLIQDLFNWNGRYISNIFVFINPISKLDFGLYKSAPIGIILFTIFSFGFFIKSIIGTQIKQSAVRIYALVLTLFYIYQMPIISEGIYWYTGAVTYVLGCAFMLIYLGLLYGLFKERYVLNSKIVQIVLTTIALFVTIGFNEILMIALATFSLVFLLVLYRNKLANIRLALYFVIATMLFSGLVYLAPGNSVRGNHFEDSHNFIHSFGMSVAQTGRFFVSWVLSIPLILLSILYYFLHKKLVEGITLFAKSFYLIPVVSGGLLLFTIFIGSFPAYWSTGMLGQHRTMNVSYFLFIITWFVNLSVCFNHFKIPSFQITQNRRYMVLILIWVSLVFTKNGYHVIADLASDSAVKFNQQMEERYTTFTNSGDTVYFDLISNPPKTLFVLDITDDPNHWLNEGYSIFLEDRTKVVLPSDSLE